MHNLDKIGSKSLLILNKPQFLTTNDFYVRLFKVPEIFNKLRNYRELLSQNHINIPIWIYCLIQDISTLRGTAQIEVVNFLISMGLYERYTSKLGWPDYILGSGSLISVITGESTFENEILDLTANPKDQEQVLSLIKTKSYYSTKTKNFCLTNLKVEMQSYSLKDIFKNLNQKSDDEPQNIVSYFLCPHEDGLLDYMNSIGVSSRDFLEYDEDLKWLWPIWKRTQLYNNPTKNLA